MSTPGQESYDVDQWAPNNIKKAAYVVCPTDPADISVAILVSRLFDLNAQHQFSQAIHSFSSLERKTCRLQYVVVGIAVAQHHARKVS